MRKAEFPSGRLEILGGFYDPLSKSMVRMALAVYTLIKLQTHMAFYEEVVYTKSGKLWPDG